MFSNKKWQRHLARSLALALLVFAAHGFFSGARWSQSRALAQTAQPLAVTVYALTANNRLIAFNSPTPGALTGNVAITGLGAGETLVGIDFRPANNQLYGVSSASRIYTINTTTGAATAVGSTAFTPALTGTAFGVDFNPVPDRIRLVSDAEQNLRLHPDTGAVAGTDTALVYATGDPSAGANPNLVGAAYTNNFRGATTTTLYGIDSNLDRLVRQGSVGGAPISPNSGQLFTVGALGINTNDQVGFDIAAPNDLAFASLTTQGASNSALYSINLNTGAATPIGTIGGGAVVSDLAIPVTFAPTAQQAGFAVLNAASFSGDVLAPDTIAAVFGPFQTQNSQVVVATTVPLPTTLGGLRVSVNGTDASLFFAAPGQINIRIPSNVPDGQATFTITDATGAARSGTVSITRTSPGIFTANASGSGTAAGFVTSDGVNFQSLRNPDGSERPIDPGTRSRPTYLILFGTGWRNAPADNPNDGNGVAEGVTATIQGVPATVAYASRTPDFEGLDQLNLIIPPELAGFGRLRLRLVVNGQPSNFVTLTIGGTPPAVNLQPIAHGQTIGGALSADDQVLGDEAGRTYFFDAYRFTASAGTGILADLRSTVFDAAAILYKRNANGSLEAVAADDDLGGLGDGDIVNGNALLLTVVQESGEYVVVVTSSENSPNATGGYTLRLLANALRPIAYGTTVNGAISTDDLQTAAGDYLDVFFFAGVQGDAVQIRLNSPAFDPLLILNGNNGTTLSADDNGGGGQNALITRTLPNTGYYVIIATPFAPGRRGDYILTLNRSTSAAAEALAEAPTAPAPSRLAPVNILNGEADAPFEHLQTRRVQPRD